MALIYRGLDIMGWTKDKLKDPKDQSAIDAHVAAIAADFPNLTHVGISIPMNTNAEASPDFPIEPSAYAARFTSAIHDNNLKVLFRGTNNYFEGLYTDRGFFKTNLQNSVFRDNAVDWIDSIHTEWETGDLFGCFPEAYAHQNLSDGGQYDNFFIGLKDAIEAQLTTRGKTVDAGMTAQNFTDALQNRNGRVWPIFQDSGIAVIDHYGTTLGPGRKWLSFTGRSNSGSATYTCPTTISESNIHKYPFTPEKIAYNQDFEIFVVNPGSGSMTVTCHKHSNNANAKMVDHTDITNTWDSYTVTVPNNQLVANAYNVFSFPWFNQPDEAFHLHITSEFGDATVKVHASHAGDLGGDQAAYPGGWLVCRQYKVNASPEAMEIDIRNLYAKVGLPIFLQEWGDHWSTDSSKSSPVRNQAQHEAYLDSMYAAFQRLVDDDILVGFQYWRAVEGHEALYDSTGTVLQYEGQRLQEFFANNAEAPTAPAAPSSLSLNVVSTTAIDLSWTDNSASETSFKVERKTGAGGTYAQIGTTGIDDTTFSDTGLLPGTQYYYRVRASNASGDSAYLTEVNATTTAATQVAAPAIAPNGGTYVGTVTVTITTETGNATIHYTIDGSTPTTSSPVYSSPIQVPSPSTVKAIAVRDGYTDSSVNTVEFTVASQPGGRLSPKRRRNLLMIST